MSLKDYLPKSGLLGFALRQKDKPSPAVPPEIMAQEMSRRPMRKSRQELKDYLPKSGLAGLAVRRMNKGGKAKSKSKPSASKRADGCAQRGKTRGKMV
jgi:hypothetical protein